MSNEVNEEFVYNLSKMLNVPVSEVVQKLGYVEMVGNPFWKSEEDRKSASPEPAAPAAPKGGDQRLSSEPKAAAAPAPTRMPTGGDPDRRTPNPMITEGDRDLGGMGANAASGSAGVQGQRDGSWRGQTPETLIPERLADNQTVYEAGDGSGGGAPQGRRNASNGGYLPGGAEAYVQGLPPRPQPQAPRPQPQVTQGGPSTPIIPTSPYETFASPPIIPTSPYETFASPPEMMGPPSPGEEARVEGVPYSDEKPRRVYTGIQEGRYRLRDGRTNGFEPYGSQLDQAVSSLFNGNSQSIASTSPRTPYVPTGVDSTPPAQARPTPTPTPTGKSYSAIFNNNDPEAMLKKLAEITGVRQDEIVKKLGNANFSENPFFDKDPRY